MARQRSAGSLEPPPGHCRGGRRCRDVSARRSRIHHVLETGGRQISRRWNGIEAGPVPIVRGSRWGDPEPGRSRSPVPGRGSGGGVWPEALRGGTEGPCGRGGSGPQTFAPVSPIPAPGRGLSGGRDRSAGSKVVARNRARVRPRGFGRNRPRPGGSPLASGEPPVPPFPRRGGSGGSGRLFRRPEPGRGVGVRRRRRPRGPLGGGAGGAATGPG